MIQDLDFQARISARRHICMRHLTMSLPNVIYSAVSSLLQTIGWVSWWERGSLIYLFSILVQTQRAVLKCKRLTKCHSGETVVSSLSQCFIWSLLCHDRAINKYLLSDHYLAGIMLGTAEDMTWIRHMKLSQSFHFVRNVSKVHLCKG